MPLASEGHELLAGLEARLEPTPTPALYRAGLALVALGMVALPLVYGAVVAATGYFVYWHAVANTSLLRHRKAGLILYASPLVVGAILVVFLLKPFLATGEAEDDSVDVEPHQEPLLAAFVERLCAVVGAPAPRRLAVDCQVNASASFLRGWWGLFSRDLTLTVGLPLLLTLDARGLASVLAHEFGHFAQGTGMRFTYVIRSVNAWFARVVYAPDTWDRWLEELGRADGHLALVGYGGRAAIWLTRRLLWVFMMAGHGMSCFMLRQMEHDADAVAVRVAGSETFVTLERTMAAATLASQAALRQLGESWAEERLLADDLPALVSARLAALPAEARDAVTRALEEASTSYFDTHPAARDRIDRARAAAAPGLLRHAGPAAALVRDLGGLGRRATAAYYRANLEGTVEARNLQPTTQFLQAADARDHGDAAAWRALQGAWHDRLQLQVPEAAAAASEEPGRARAVLEAARERLPPAGASVREALARWQRADARLQDVRCAVAQREAKLDVDAAALGLDARTPAALAAAEAEALRTMATEEASVAGVHALALERLTAAARMAGGEGERLAARLEQLAQLGGAVPLARRLQDRLAVCTALAARGEEARDEGAFGARLREAIREVHVALTSLLGGLERFELPWPVAGAATSAAAWLAEAVPGVEEPGALVGAGMGALDRFLALQRRLVGEVALGAEAVEGALGLPPLPEPPPPERTPDEGADQ